MELLCHPFIMKFYKSTKDEKNIYFVTEHVKGERLFEIIRELDEVTIEYARFYVAQLVLVL